MILLNELVVLFIEVILVFQISGELVDRAIEQFLH